MTDVAVDTSAEWWTTTEVADYLGVRVGTVSSYRQRGQMPAPGPDARADAPVAAVDDRAVAAASTSHRRGRRRRRACSGRSAGETSSAWQIHGERNLYDNEWVRLSLVDVELPDGQRFEHHVVTMKPAAVTALLDESEERVLLLWRHRFASDVWNWELPGGLLEPGEDPAATAARELEEETGYRARELEHVVDFEPAIGMVRSRHHVFVARAAERLGEPTEQTEMERMEWVPLDDVLGLIRDGKILNAGTLVALALRSRGADVFRVRRRPGRPRRSASRSMRFLWRAEEVASASSRARSACVAGCVAVAAAGVRQREVDEQPGLRANERRIERRRALTVSSSIGLGGAKSSKAVAAPSAQVHLVEEDVRQPVAVSA